MESNHDLWGNMLRDENVFSRVLSDLVCEDWFIWTLSKKSANITNNTIKIDPTRKRKNKID